MILDDSYDFYFENNGRCPECGRWLVPHIGCIGANFGESANRDHCSIAHIHKKRYNETHTNIKHVIHKLLKKYAYKRKNLDIQREKSYIKINN